MPRHLEVVGVLRRIDNEWAQGYEIFCPGCGYLHYVAVEKPLRNGARWGFDGDHASPSFTPSLLITVPAVDEPDWKQAQSVCHSFIRAGHWEFLGDCTHALKSQRVPVPPHPASTK
jgi:hypothetical protein